MARGQRLRIRPLPAAFALVLLIAIVAAWIILNPRTGSQEPQVAGNRPPLSAPNSIGEQVPHPETGPDQSSGQGETVAVGTSQVSEPVIQIRSLSDNYVAILANRLVISDPAALEPIARAQCQDRRVCRVGIWYQFNSMPTELPVSRDSVAAMIFGFGRIEDGSENRQWNCKVYPELRGTQPCMAERRE